MSNPTIAPDLAGERVLVTGSSGVLGTALKEELARLPVEASFFPTRADCDLLDRAAVTAYFEAKAPTVVMHLAGRVYGVQGNMDYCGLSFYENALMNINVVEAARERGVRKIVCAGTTAIYSDLVKLPMREDDFWLGAPHGSEAAYAHAKRAMLAQLEAYQTQYGLDFAYLILTNLYGPNDRFDAVRGHVVPSLIDKFSKATASGAEKVEIWGDGSPTRDFLFSSDAARAFVVAASSGHGVYNVASGAVSSIRQLAEAVRDATEFSGELFWDVTKPLGQLQRSYDITRITGLGWKAQVSLRDGIRKTAEWYRDNSAALRV